MIVDCSGVPAAVEAAFRWLAPGATFVQFGCCPMGSCVTIDPHAIFAKELRIIGSKIDKFSMARAVQVVLDMTPNYFADLGRLGIAMYALEDHEAALAKLAAGSISKAVFDFTVVATSAD